MYKLFVVLAVVAASHAQYLTPSITTQNQNIYRSYGNLGQVSTYSKTIDTPYSSVSKSDVRVSNPGIAVARSYAAPITAGYAAPIAAHYSAPIATHYSAPIATSYAAPIASGYVSPVARTAYAAPIAKVAGPAGLLGVAYSAAPAVAHTTFSNALVNYAW